ncbi:MAG TPA: hypothetical protein VF618_08720 [Thermoanaerobaculia bacterium]
MTTTKVAEVVWYVTGRFYGQGASLEDVGYFVHLQGIDGELFDGKKSEATALFTFASQPFTKTTIQNGPISINLDTTGTFGLYLRDSGGATFDDPSSFAVGQCIATFQRVSVVASADVGTLSNVFSATLLSTEPFTFRGRTYDLRDLIGDGITQWGLASAAAISAPEGYDSVVAFVGSAIRLG